MPPRTQREPSAAGRAVTVSFHKFIDRLNRSGLLTTAELQSLLSSAPNDQRPGSAEELARWLVRQGHLTQFQAKAIYVGHTKGLIVGNYVILDLLGVGGMGQVYKAQHRRMKRIVALKLLSPEVATKPSLVERFHKEVEAAARLMHPNIVTAFDADEADGKHFLVMEYVPGRDLASLVKQRGRLSVDRSIRCVLDAARGLEYAHNHGVVHRDVKPSNLLLATAEGDSAVDDAPLACVKILDMGLARVEAEAEGVYQPSDLTKTGVVMGTVDYMSPEQAINTHDADHRSDIYSLGITLYFLLIGQVPFTGRTVIEQVLAHRDREIPSLREARKEVPSTLDAIFRKMVAKRPEDRYQSMGDVVAHLESVLSGADSESDLPVIVESREHDDSALSDFLVSMAGDETEQRRAAAAVITPATPSESGVETLVASEQSTAVDRWSRVSQRKNRPVPWGAILLHATWSIGLLGFAVGLLLSSRDHAPAPESPADGEEISTPAPTDESGDSTGTAIDEDADRQLAEWMLTKGGSVSVAGAAHSLHVDPGLELPRWAFFVTAINLPGAAVSADDLTKLAELSRLTMLQTIELADCPNVDDGWIESITPFSRLRHLGLSGSAITDGALSELPRLCPTLEVLDLSECAVDGSGFEPLTRLPNLRQLILEATPLTEAAVPHLASMTSLRELDIRQTSIPVSKIQLLRESLPDCTVIADNGARRVP